MKEKHNFYIVTAKAYEHNARSEKTVNFTITYGYEKLLCRTRDRLEVWKFLEYLISADWRFCVVMLIYLGQPERSRLSCYTVK